MPQKITFAHMLQQLMTERYRRNRAALAEAAHISPSALSQYVRGKATPSLDVLAHLADALDVSLDYLVFGQERIAPPPELGYLTGHIEAHVRGAQVQAEALHDLIARIGAQASAQMPALVRSVAQALIADGASLAGTLSPEEIVAIERCDVSTTIVTSDLSNEILVLEQEGNEDAAAPGFFAQVVTENIAAGNHYEYLVPHRPNMRHAGSLLREQLARLSRLEPSTLDRRFRIAYVPNACVPGFVVHHVVMERLLQRAAHLEEQIARFVYPDPDNKKLGLLAIVTPASPSYQRYCLVDRQDIPYLMDEIHAMRKGAIP